MRRSDIGTLSRLLIAAVVLLAGCERDFALLPLQNDIRFSTDTLTFDTVYADLPTPTGHLTLHNTGDEDVMIERVMIEGGEHSPFAINVNGHSSPQVEGLRLAHGDSLYIFITLRNAAADPKHAIRNISDHIVASSGNNNWRVCLTAGIQSVRRVGGVIETGEMWMQDTIPYLVCDSLEIAAEGELLIGSGVTVLMDKKSKILVRGKMRLLGNDRQRISIRHLRQGAFYSDIPGQWDGIYVTGGGNLEAHSADVMCSTEGLICDSSTVVEADGIRIGNTSHNALTVNKAEVHLTNSMLTDCGGAALMLNGGTAWLCHTTIANFFRWNYRDIPSVRIADTSAVMTMTNSIVSGNKTHEIVADSIAYDGIRIANCWLRTTATKKIDADTIHFANCKTGTDIKFFSIDDYDYHLTSESEAIGIADIGVSTSYPFDFEGTYRMETDTIQPGALQLKK